LKQGSVVIAILATFLGNANDATTSRLAETYRYIRSLGRGGFGVVELVEHSVSKKWYARKSMDIYNIPRQDVDVVRNEAKTLNQLQNDHIVLLVEFLEHSTDDKAELWLIMEYCDGGDLEHYITRRARECKGTRDIKIPEDVVLLWLQQLSKALEVCMYISERNVTCTDVLTIMVSARAIMRFICRFPLSTCTASVYFIGT
jgi:serine/threonine protein kinase